LLLLALEDYFKAPHPATLASLYNAVNTMDLSLMPRLTILERHLLQASDNKDLFVEKFEEMIQMRMAEERGDRDLSQSGDLSQSPERTRDLTRNGTKAHVHGQSEYSVPRDTHEFETKVIYNGIPIPIKVPVAISPETVGDFSLIKLIQTFSEPHIKSPQAFPLHSHLTTGGAFTHPIIVLVNAMLTQKRVLFLGHNRPSGEVAEAVLAACALTSGGILRGFTRHAFPYTDLSKIDDLLKVPGFIAGVTNPTFENHPEWWDVICDLPTGRVKISSRIEPAPVTEGLIYFQQQNPQYASLASVANSTTATTSDPTGDAAFMADILRSIAARHGECVIRAKWRAWVEKFTRVAAAFEESVYGASALYIGGEEAGTGVGIKGHGYVWSDEASKVRELAGGVSRIEGWRNTRSYYSFIQVCCSRRQLQQKY
jgi:Stabilization of polarity axis